VDKVVLGQVFPRVPRFFPVNFIPLVVHYTEKREKLIIFLIIFIIGLHNKPQDCGASVASAAGPLMTKKDSTEHNPFQKPKDCSASQEISLLLWKPKCYYCLRNSQSLAPVSSHFNPLFI
jgi:hypothetical protein